MHPYGEYSVLECPFLTKLKHLILRALNRGANPLIVNFAVTWRCNSRCVMCNIWKRKVGWELSPGEIGEIFSDKLFSRLKLLKVMGGEPLMRNDLLDVLLAIDEWVKPVYVISTNAFPFSRFKRVSRRIFETFGERVVFSISLDALGDKHSSMRGVKFAYNEVMKSVAFLRAERARFRFSTTVMEENSKDFENVIKLGKVLGVYVGYRPAANSIFYGNLEKKFLLSKETKERILRNADNDFKKGFKSWFDGRRPHRCYALVTRVFIDPKGMMHACVNRGALVSLLQTSPSKAWNSREVREERKRVKKCKGCWTDCEGIPDILTGL